MISQKELENLDDHALQKQVEENNKEIERLKIIIKDFDYNLSKINELFNEAEDSIYEFRKNSDLLKEDFKDETNFWIGRNKATINLYFESQSHEELYYSSYERLKKKEAELLDLEEKFLFFNRSLLENEPIAWDGSNMSYKKYDFHNSHNPLGSSGQYIITRTDSTNEHYNKLREIKVRYKKINFNRTPIPTKDLYEKYFEIYERQNRKIELLKRSRIREISKTENIGTVYIMSNKSLPKDTYKIGSTFGLPEERAEELSGTGHLTPFIVVGKIKIQSAEYYEKLIHKLLKDYRVRKDREYFTLNLDIIKNCLKQVSEISKKGSQKITLAELKMEKIL